MDQIKKYYLDNIRKFGKASYKALGWEVEYLQKKRFEALSQIGPMEGHRILDLGSGHGDLYGFLKETYPTFDYLGLEIVEEFIKQARQKYPDAQFIQQDFLTFNQPVDYVLASGSFSVRNGYSRADYFQVITEYLKHAYRLAKKGVGVNFLNDFYTEDEFGCEAFILSSKEVRLLTEEVNPSWVQEVQDEDLQGEYTLLFYHS